GDRYTTSCNGDLRSERSSWWFYGYRQPDAQLLGGYGARASDPHGQQVGHRDFRHSELSGGLRRHLHVAILLSSVPGPDYAADPGLLGQHPRHPVELSASAGHQSDDHARFYRRDNQQPDGYGT